MRTQPEGKSMESTGNRLVREANRLVAGYLIGNRKTTDQKCQRMRKAVKCRALRTMFLFDSDLAGEPMNRYYTVIRSGQITAP